MVNLVVDIGGTNLRVGITNKQNVIDKLQLYKCAHYSDLSSILEDYFELNNLASKEINACIAIACPVETDNIAMTNLPWVFSQSELKKKFGFNKLYIINDYTAIAYAVPMLNNQQKTKVGQGQAVKGKPIAICGPGTGLGVANIVFKEELPIVVSGEGGHVDFAPTDPTEIAILSFLLTKYEHVSYEQLLSGLGIEQIYQALCHISKKAELYSSAEEISANATRGNCEVCYQTLHYFCKILGSFAGNLALTLASFGGVYIAGGIVPRFVEFTQNSEFRKSFESKGRFTEFNQQIPTYIITEPYPGMIGASAFLNQKL